MSAVGNRVLTVLLFAIIGPFIGAFSLLLWALANGAASAGMDWSGVASAFPFFVVMGYVFGAGPALLAGVIYSLLPGGAQRLVLAPLYGAIATWLATAIGGLFSASFASFGQSGMMWTTGAVAAFFCALVARNLGWMPKHGGGETDAGTENTAN